ncbi:hypothetical protein SAMN02787142_7982 [Burkholderia sp. WP9]|nr:hypothetical protein [Burkholderia sp. WP9]SEF13094.1 hypothetical protein SAMN02787142_7982 [Burkholderia sp. WP9]
MKKLILALVTTVVTAGATLPAYAYDNHHHCHKVKVHHHWEKRCH